MQNEVQGGKKLPWLKLAIGAGVLLVVGVLLLRGVDLGHWKERGMELIRSAGPVAFFLGMAILPCFGAPMLTFTLTAGSAFSEQLGLGWVVALSVLAVCLNVALSHFLARRALGPVLESLLTRFGYKLPQVEAGDATDLVIICRVTPGIPFCVQNYLLGLANVPFGKYFLVSCAIVSPQIAAFVVFGNALLEGRGKIAFISLSLLLALGAGTQLLRRHYGRKKRPA